MKLLYTILLMWLYITAMKYENETHYLLMAFVSLGTVALWFENYKNRMTVRSFCFGLWVAGWTGYGFGTYFYLIYLK